MRGAVLSNSSLPEGEQSEGAQRDVSESHVYTAERLLSTDFPAIEEVVECMFVAAGPA